MDKERIPAKSVCIVRQAPYPQDLMLRREAEALREAGMEVSVITTSLPPAQSEEKVAGIHVYRLLPVQKKGSLLHYLYKYVLFFFGAAFKVTVLYLRKQFSFIQVNTMPDFLVFSTLIPRLLGSKVTLFMYEPMPELWATLFRPRWVIRVLEIMQRAAAGYAHAVFVVTEQQKATLVARGVDPGKITVVLNTPDPQVWTAIPTAEKKSDHHFTLICHGAIEERYGHDTMLAAIREVKEKIPHIRLRILGVGSGRDRFLEQRKALRLEPWVQYLGYVSVGEMAEALRQADVGIVAQKESPYAHLIHTGKMYDYLSFGLPVIASRLQALEAYFPKDSLYFFEPGDPGSLGKAVLDLYAHSDKRELLVRNSQRLYEQYKWERQKENYLSVYASLVG